ncbi:MmgE/PrpD family protein [Arthrobacter yangruifuii]|uniref:MmgE/PrpD family protein n=1 Tax=Arthrobacter yangruifuii TaxID=2606616 RepID=UPI0011B80FA1|nr:MmgE/PrpD family protein [Arthrobacter yangruifuii]
MSISSDHPDLFNQLAELISEHASTPLPDDVRSAARRTLYNVCATAVGAAREPALDITVAAASGFGRGTASVPGRTELLQPLDAALATGIAAHLDDFDDTHLSTVIHPGAVGLATLVALQNEIGDNDSEEILSAFAWGIEIQLRLGVSVSPEHYDEGWHITGTCGAIGGAVTAGLLLRLDREQMAAAISMALEGGVGNREAFGSMTKPFHPGKAAVNGLRAAKDAASGTHSVGDALTGKEGFVPLLSAGKFNPESLLADFSSRWELLDNTFKPYPCGIVTHPAIEAAEALHAQLSEHGGTDQVSEIRLTCHPLVPELTGNMAPQDGLQARFSTAHGVAAGLILGAVGLNGYRNELVHSPEAARLRSAVTFNADAGCGRDAARLEVQLRDGAVLVQEVDHARGSLRRPLTDDELMLKAEGLIEPVIRGGAKSIDAAARSRGHAYLSNLLAACEPNTARESGTAEAMDVLVDDETEDHVLVRYIAADPDLRQDEEFHALITLLNQAKHLAAELDSGDVASDDTDSRTLSGEIAVSLVATGHSPVVAAAAAVCATVPGPEATALKAMGTALTVTSLLTERLKVPSERLSLLTATIARAAITRLSVSQTLMALGIAATQITLVTGVDTSGPAQDRRLRLSVMDGLETVALAAHGFTGPTHPLTGRRGMLRLLTTRTEPSLRVLTDLQLSSLAGLDPDEILQGVTSI